MHTHDENKSIDQRMSRMAAGIVLILVGTALLLTRWLNIDLYLVLLIGAGLLVWGVLARKTGLIIPGGVLSGIGLGILVYEGPWDLSTTSQNGIFLLCFSLGWFLITLLTGLFTCRTQWWALIPGSIMAVLGGAILFTDDPIIWQNLATLFPAAILILVGLFLIGRQVLGRKSE